ncbi:MAG: aldehyde dehydrogenase family protein [Myxococcota bacterium]
MQTFRRRADILAEHWRERPPHLFVGGLDVESESHSSIAIQDPATGEALGRCPSGNPRDVERAVASARRAIKGPLRTLDEDQRRDRVAKVARLLEGDAEDLMILHALETGRPVRHVRMNDVKQAILAFRYYAGWCGKLTTEHVELGDTSGTVVQHPRALVGIACDDRQPLASVAPAAAAALAAGCAVVVVCPDTMPLALLRLAELIHEAGLPPGAFNLVPGRTPTYEALAQHAAISVLCHQGPVDAGRRMMVLAAKSNLKPVHLQLGGKTSAIVCEDASLRRASRVAVQHGLHARGGDPEGLQRLLVHRSVYEEVASLVAHHAREVVVGDPMDEHTELGAVASEARMKQILAYVALGRKEGASLVAGGSRFVDGAASQGTFVLPSVFVQGRGDMRVFREDNEGPFLVLVPFDDDSEAVDMVQSLSLGLGVSVWTQDGGRARKLAYALDTGVVWFNTHGVRHPGLLRTGRGLSGGFAEGGRPGIDRFTQTTTFIREDG